MLQITDTAAKELKRALADLDTREDVCLRLGETQEGLRDRPGSAATGRRDRQEWATRHCLSSTPQQPVGWTAARWISTRAPGNWSSLD